MSEFIERKEVRGDDAIEYFLPTGVKNTFLSTRKRDTIELLQMEEIFGGGKNGKREDGSAIHQRASRGSINVKKKERKRVI